MFAYLWIPVTVLAAAFQVARNGLQRSAMSATGPWGATLIRFLYGVPFSTLMAVAAWTLTPRAHPRMGLDFWVSALTGALTQVLATAALLVAMRRAGFAVATAVQQSSLPLAAILGLIVYHDRLSGVAWAGVAVTTLGLAALTWPKHAAGPQPVSGAAFGLASGLCFGFSLNAYRHATLAFDAGAPVFAAVASVAIVQAVQASVMSAWLKWRDPKAFAAVLASWRTSLAAGLCGSLASGGWFLALALAEAAPVRAVGVVEAPMAAFAGRRFFRERLHPLQIVAGLGVLGGVLLTTLG